MGAAKWIKQQVLEKGSYGTVYLVTPQRLASSFIAAKSADIYETYSLIWEGEILHELRGCLEIIQCFGDDISVENNKNLYNLLLQYTPRGNLTYLIKTRGSKLSESEVKWYALCHIHGEGYVHCDIKPSNIFVFSSPDGLNRIKMADLVLAKRGVDNKKIIIADGTLNHFRGAPLYSSLESVLFGQYEAPMDIWSLRCIVVEMITGKPLWSYWDTNDLLYQIGYGEIDYGEEVTGEELPEMPENMLENGKNFLRRCLERYPEERWTAEMLLHHPFIVGNSMPMLASDDSLILSHNSPFGSAWVSNQSMFSTSSHAKPAFPSGCDSSELGLIGQID